MFERNCSSLIAPVAFSRLRFEWAGAEGPPALLRPVTSATEF